MSRRPILIPGVCIVYAALAVAAYAASAPPHGAVAGGTLAERYQRAQQALQEQRSSEEKTRADRDRLAAEAHDLQERLIANAAKVQELETIYETTADQLAQLNDTMSALQADFLRDRERVTHLLAVLQRLEAEEPPALALRPDDSLAAVRGTLQMGAMLPPLYHEASALAKRLKTLD